MKVGIRLIVVACAAAAVAALLLEVSLRLFWPELFPRHIPGLYAPHPELGHVLAPDREIAIERPEYRVTVRTNTDGFRGAELSPKREDTIRILCVGDWLTWGEGVEDPQTYPVLVEAALQSRHPGKDIQVVNAGVPQYGLLDELAYFESFADELGPDFVIVQFFAGDDFEQSEVPARERHEFRDGMLEQTDRFTASTGPLWLVALNRLKHRSHLVHWLSERAGRAAMRANLLIDLEQASSEHFTDLQGRRVQTLLEEIHAVGERTGARTLFVFAPEKMQVLARPREPLRAARLVAEVAEKTGAGFLDLTALLVGHEDPERLFHDTVGTWRPETYRLAAGVVTQKIIELEWLESSR